MYPNRVHVGGDRVSFGTDFGGVSSVVPLQHVKGNGHTPELCARFVGGLRLTLTPSDAVALVEQIRRALSALPNFTDCSGMTANLEDNA